MNPSVLSKNASASLIPFLKTKSVLKKPAKRAAATMKAAAASFLSSPINKNISMAVMIKSQWLKLYKYTPAAKNSAENAAILGKCFILQ